MAHITSGILKGLMITPAMAKNEIIQIVIFVMNLKAINIEMHLGLLYLIVNDCIVIDVSFWPAIFILQAIYDEIIQ